MKIEDKRVVKGTHRLHTLLAGDVFYHPDYPDEMMMRVYCAIGEDKNAFNVVNLSTGALGRWSGDESVCLANAKLVIRG